jgi:hypothetical protein
MKPKDLTFSGMVIYVDSSKIDGDSFKKVVPATTERDKNINGDRIHFFDIDYENNFLKITFSDGSSTPRQPEVFNKKDGEFEENPRSLNQVELNEHFAVLDLKSSYLWLSNANKKALLIGYLQEKTKKRVELKNVYDENRFCETLKYLDEIKLSVAPPNKLNSKPNSLDSALKDEMYDMGAYRATLHFEYNKKEILNEKIRSKVKNLFKHHDNYINIMVSGRDEKNIGILFNTDSFSLKITIKAQVNESEIFEKNDVFNKIINKIAERINANG